MDTHRLVRIRMESSAELEMEKTVQIAEGTLYDKADSWYLRYEEPDNGLGKTTSTLKINLNYIKIMRRGGVISDMMFHLNERMSGFYKTTYSYMPLETFTHSIHIDMEESKGLIDWKYDLTVEGALPVFRSVTVTLSY